MEIFVGQKNVDKEEDEGGGADRSHDGKLIAAVHAWTNKCATHIFPSLQIT